jgi:hypothetical protein
MEKNTLSKIVSVLLIFEIFLMWPFFFHTIFSDHLGIDDVEGLLLIILLIPYFIVDIIHEYFIPEILFALCFFACLILLIQKIRNKEKYRNFLILFIVFLIICVPGFVSYFEEL